MARTFEPHYGTAGTFQEVAAQIANIHRYLVGFGHDAVNPAQQNQGSGSAGTANEVSGITGGGGGGGGGSALYGDVVGPLSHTVVEQASGQFGVGAPVIGAARMSIQAIRFDDVGLLLQNNSAPGPDSVDYLWAKDHLGNLVASLDFQGHLNLTPVAGSGPFLGLIAPVGAAGTLVEIMQASTPAFTVSSPGAGHTNQMFSASDADTALNVVGFSLTQTAPLFSVQQTQTGGDVFDIGLAGVQTGRLIDATTNILSDVVVLDHTSTGTPAVGWGHSVHFIGKSSTTIQRDMARIDTLWATAADATRKSRVAISAFDTAAREGLRVEASGSVPMLGFLGQSAVVRQAGASAATIALIVDPNAAAAIAAIQAALGTAGTGSGLITSPP